MYGPYGQGSKDLVNFVRLVAQQRVLCVCDFSKPGSAMEDSFQRHLEALNAVYEQVILENAQLRKQLGQAPEFGDLRQLTQSGSMPPLPPMATVSTLNLQESTVQLPGALCDSEKLSPQILEGDPIEPPGDGAKGDTNEDSASCNGDNAPSLPETPRPPASSPPKMTDHMKSLKSRASRRSSFLRNSLRTNDSDEETEDDVACCFSGRTRSIPVTSALYFILHGVCVEDCFRIFCSSGDSSRVHSICRARQPSC